MKKILMLALCLLPVTLIAAGVEPEPHQVFLNGKSFSHAYFINGAWAIPPEDVARGCGTTTSPGSGIHVDQLGRVAVQFFWDFARSPDAVLIGL